MISYFCDRLGDVVVLNGVARLQFQRLDPLPGGQGREQGHETRPVAEFAIAMPLQGLLQALDVLGRLRDRLAQEGIISTGATDGNEPPKEPLILLDARGNPTVNATPNFR